MKTAIYWLRKDLRLHDNLIFNSKLGAYDRLLPIYIFEQNINERHIFGFSRVGIQRKRFLVETLSNLRSNLKNLKSDLIVLMGYPENIIPELAQKVDADIIYATKEHTQEETKTENRVKEKLGRIPLKLVEQISLIRPDHLPISVTEIPDAFTDFRKFVEKKSKIRSPFPKPVNLPELPKLNNFGEIVDLEELKRFVPKTDTRSAFNFQGGETESLRRLKDYIWERKLILNYKQRRNELLGEDYSSKFSPWLAIGALSPRQIYHHIKEFERIETKNSSTYWLVFELLWRDYFRFIAIKYGNNIFKNGGIKKVVNKYSNNFSLFERWMKGKTGNDFVDANMAELNLTGFMSNRGRQNVASYLVHELNIDWRWGAAYFESQLIDYDVCSNWGNWMYIAGVGNDPRPNRKFNTSLQARKYDPHKNFRNKWLRPQQKVS